MIDARLLMAGSAVYTPWVPRGGDNLRATLDVVDLGTSGEITVSVWTKNSEDTGDGSDANGSVSITRSSVGRTTQEWEGDAKEWVRYKIVVNGNWVLFRMLEPVWFDTVDA